MTDTIGLTIEEFPAPSAEVRAKWLPVYLEPIMGSGERLTIGLAVVGESGFTVLTANKLSRFQCLYGNSGMEVVFLAEAALDALRLDIAERGLEALTVPRPAIAGLHLGQLRDGAGASLEAIAEAWLPGLSSLASQAERLLMTASAADAEAVAEEIDTRIRDRLPTLVAQEVVTVRPGLADFFRPELRPDAHTRKHVKSHKVNIDFTGARIVANFCTLFGTRPFKAAKDIKTRLWDLKVDRDSAGKLPGFRREHELLVFRPANDDPNFSERQLANVGEALEELEQQAEQEEIRLRPLISVAEMATRILQAETAVRT